MAVSETFVARHRALGRGWLAVLIVFSTAGVLLSINQVFNLRFLSGYVLLENSYLYVLLALFFPLTFLMFPAAARARRDGVPWYDLIFFAVAVLAPLYFAWNGHRIIAEAWDFKAPTEAVVVGAALWLVILEGARRAGGTALFVMLVVLSLYPVYAGVMPGPIAGLSMSLPDAIRYQTMSVEAILGIPMRVFGTLIVGFIIFGAALQATGGGRFFIDLSMAILGAFRGGPAKVAVVASGLFGSMSGSVVSNVLSTGVVTIPTMVRTGFRPEVAAAIEATASTGGTLMPPIMGAVAFVMASILGIPYLTVAIAAGIPSLLFYASLFFQIDAYAARNSLHGLSWKEMPSFWATLRAGWFYLGAFAVLVFLLVSLRREVHAPFFATAILLGLAMIRKETRFTARTFLTFLAETGRTLAELVTVLAAVGLIIGALAVTGVAGTFSSDMIRLAGGNLMLLLVFGALACFILGMGMTATAAYVFLAVVLAPALIQQGLNPLAVHLFILYWAMLSFITPPVAIGAYAAATIARCSPMRAGVEAMRFGFIKYLLPFLFVFNPALVAQNATVVQIVLVSGAALLGVAILAYALQGYVLGIGTVANTPAGYLVRAVLVIAGVLLTVPEVRSDLIGLGLAAVTYAVMFGVTGARRALVVR
ncbi:MAG: TRAP transporter permease [Candidatus Rokubacteria bacterium]|nr:TRAP transporter permease [Candidatus Rokubacteria bacterium]